MAGDEADRGPRLAQLAAGELDGLRIVGLVAQHDDLDRPVAHAKRPPSGRSNARLIAPGPGKKMSWSPRHTYIGALPMSSPQRTEDVAVEQRLGGDQVGVVPGRHGELRPLRREQAADGPLVVVARAVVGQHGEAHRAVERRGRRRERAAGEAPCRRRSRPRRSAVSGRRPRRTPPATSTGVPSGSVAVTSTRLPPRTFQRSTASSPLTRSRYGPRVNGVSAGPRDTRPSTRSSRPRRSRRRRPARRARRARGVARVRRRWSSSSREDGSGGLAIPAR